MAYTDYKSQGLPNSNTYSDGLLIGAYGPDIPISIFSIQTKEYTVVEISRQVLYWADNRFLDIKNSLRFVLA